MQQQLGVQVTFPQSIAGYWDGGRKSDGTFTIDTFASFPPGFGSNPNHPGSGNTFQWGCFHLNFWFTCGSGRSWREAAAIAKRKLLHLCKVSGSTVEIVEL